MRLETARRTRQQGDDHASSRTPQYSLEDAAVLVDLGRALPELQALLGDAPRRRDLLIEHLHLINDRFGKLSAQHLAALAQEMRMAQTEVYEVATFIIISMWSRRTASKKVLRPS